MNKYYNRLLVYKTSYDNNLVRIVSKDIVDRYPAAFQPGDEIGEFENKDLVIRLEKDTSKDLLSKIFENNTYFFENTKVRGYVYIPELSREFAININKINIIDLLFNNLNNLILTGASLLVSTTYVSMFLSSVTVITNKDIIDFLYKSNTTQKHKKNKWIPGHLYKKEYINMTRYFLYLGEADTINMSVKNNNNYINPWHCNYLPTAAYSYRHFFSEDYPIPHKLPDNKYMYIFIINNINNILDSEKYTLEDFINLLINNTNMINLSRTTRSYVFGNVSPCTIESGGDLSLYNASIVNKNTYKGSVDLGEYVSNVKGNLREIITNTFNSLEFCKDNDCIYSLLDYSRMNKDFITKYVEHLKTTSLTGEDIKEFCKRWNIKLDKDGKVC